MAIQPITDLVLLIGTNPLPNLVVADYLLQKHPRLTKIWLVHSEKTQQQSGTNEHARNLIKLLYQRWPSHVALASAPEMIALSDVSMATEIYKDLEKQLLKRLSPSGLVHLNYTGGTKSMSVHVYAALHQNIRDKIEFSYLDARTFRLISDNPAVMVMEADLRHHVSLSFEDMIALHGFERKNKDQDNPLTTCLPVYEHLLQEGGWHLIYGDEGFDRNLFMDRNDKGQLASKISRLTESNREKMALTSRNDAFMELINRMPEAYRLYRPDGTLNDSLSASHFKSAVKYIDGLWLEDYLFNLLSGKLNRPRLEFQKDWQITKPEWGGQLDFQLDVITVNGYQLTGISCTMSDEKPVCKSKGFEIIHRTRQIGGDEAKAVLVTRLPDKVRDLVQAELEVHTGGSQSNILVLGNTDLIHNGQMLRKIEAFICDN